MNIDFLSKSFLTRNTELQKGDREREIVLKLRVYGIDEDYGDSRTPRNVEYKFRAHEDSIGTALNNMYQVALVAILQAMKEEDSCAKPYENFGDLHTLFDLTVEDDEGRQTSVVSGDQVQAKLYLARKLFALQIGGEIHCSFDDVEFHISMKRKAEKENL